MTAKTIQSSHAKDYKTHVGAPAEYFPDEQSVNTALRTLIQGAKRPLCRARWACVSSKEKTKSKPAPLKNTRVRHPADVPYVVETFDDVGREVA